MPNECRMGPRWIDDFTSGLLCESVGSDRRQYKFSFGVESNDAVAIRATLFVQPDDTRLRITSSGSQRGFGADGND